MAGRFKRTLEVRLQRIVGGMWPNDVAEGRGRELAWAVDLGGRKERYQWKYQNLGGSDSSFIKDCLKVT